MSGSDGVVMRAIGITKSYGGTRALKGVDFSIRKGSVTVLFGENGAGKSTLMKILSGVETPTSGTLELDGEPLQLRGTVDAASRGIAIIHQELSLAPNLNVRDNIYMGREKARGGVLIDYGTENATTVRLMERLEEYLDPKTLVGDLRLGQQQIVEIARALAGEARVLIMDEPTSALSGSEVEVLFRLIRELTAENVAIVYISHHLEEALEIADHAVVFRDGDLVALGDRDEIDLGWVISNMVGRDVGDLSPDLRDEFGEPVLSLRDVVIADPSNPARLAIDGLSLDVRAGEIVCLYGLMGAGRTELLEALAGRTPIQSGTVELKGRALGRESVAERIALGLALVPEDRQRDGLVQTMSVGENSSLANLLAFVKGLMLSKRAGARKHRQGRRGCQGQDLRSVGRHYVALRRQPTESRDRQNPDDQSGRHPAGRTLSRNRRRCESRNLRAHGARGQAWPRRAVRDLRSWRSLGRLQSCHRAVEGAHRGRIRPEDHRP